MPDDTFMDVPLASVVCTPQVRTEFDPEKEARMVESVREVGVLTPIRLRKAGDQYEVVVGGRRVRAARTLGLKTIPAMVEGATLDAGQVLTRQLIENCQRESLLPLEQAAALKRLLEATGWTAAVAAQHLGLSPASVSRSLALLDAPAWVQQKLAAGDLSASAAYELAKETDPQRQVELAAQMAEGKLTRDGLRGTRRAKAPTTPAAKRVVVPLDADRSIAFIGGCPSLEGLIAWAEDLLSKARRVRQQGLALPTFAKMMRDQAKAAGVCS